MKNMDVDKNESNSIRWLSIAAGITALIGIAGLAALMSHGAWAAPPTPASPPSGGFNAGSKTFSNPFGNSGTNDEMDDEDDLDFGDENGGPAKGGTAGNAAAGAPGQPKPGISMGGQPENGLISGSTAPNIQISSETGDGTSGSKDLVTDFNYPDADIMDIAKTLGRLMGKNFIYRQGRQRPHQHHLQLARSRLATPGRLFSPPWTSTASR